MNTDRTSNRKTWMIQMPDSLRLLVHLTIQEDTTWPREYLATVQSAYEQWTDLPAFERKSQGDLLQQYETWCNKVKAAERQLLKSERAAFLALTPCFDIC